MTRLYSIVAAAALVMTSLSASAQNVHSLHSHGHDYWHHPIHVVNIAKLDAYADKLFKVAHHLHEDAHQLSQDYEHSESIEGYVDAIERLQKHIHELLHEANETGTQSSALTSHVKSDVRQVRSLLIRLNSELRHQGFDGARTSDFYLMAHMRQIIFNEGFPLVRQMENELYGHGLGVYSHNAHWRSSGTRGWSHHSRFGH